MTTDLTNEQCAKAIGWKDVHIGFGGTYWGSPPNHVGPNIPLPLFLTSVDVTIKTGNKTKQGTKR